MKYRGDGRPVVAVPPFIVQAEQRGRPENDNRCFPPEEHLNENEFLVKIAKEHLEHG